MPPVVMTGRVKGHLLEEVCRQTGLEALPLVAVAQHDSASAAVAVPADIEDFLFINSGTWSILGMVSDGVNTSHEFHRLGFSNDGAAYGRARLVGSIMGV